jgi:hypothetical protein
MELRHLRYFARSSRSNPMTSCTGCFHDYRFPYMDIHVTPLATHPSDINGVR